MKTRKILFVVEGKSTEPELIDKIYSACFSDEKYEVFPYNTNIHDLVDRIFVEDEIDEGFDLKLLLYSICKDVSQREILKNEFSDIFLIFDFDPQDNRINFERLKKLQEYFYDSTNNGKLYINYPMHEAYKNINRMPDERFIHSTVAEKDIHDYKKLANSQTPYYTDISKLDKKTIFGLSAHHLRKFNYLLYTKPSCLILQDEITGEELLKLLEIQADNLLVNEKVFIISTLMLHIFEFQPKKILRLLPDVAGDYYGFDG